VSTMTRAELIEEIMWNFPDYNSESIRLKKRHGDESYEFMVEDLESPGKLIPRTVTQQELIEALPKFLAQVRDPESRKALVEDAGHWDQWDLVGLVEVAVYGEIVFC